MKHRITKVPVDQVDSGILELMKASSDALGGNEWIQVMAHSPELYKDFAAFYYKHVMADREGLSIRLTELVRHRVALHNECYL